MKSTNSSTVIVSLPEGFSLNEFILDPSKTTETVYFYSSLYFQSGEDFQINVASSDKFDTFAISNISLKARDRTAELNVDGNIQTQTLDVWDEIVYTDVYTNIRAWSCVHKGCVAK